MKLTHACLLVLLISSSLPLFLFAEEIKGPPLNVTVTRFDSVAKPIKHDVEAELVSLNNTSVSAELSAKVVKINVNIGDHVSKGDVLARLDCRDFDISVKQAKAGIETVRARIAASTARTKASRHRVNAINSRIDVGNSQINAARSRVNAAMAKMHATGTQINTAKASVNNAQAQAEASEARVPSAHAQLTLAEQQFHRNQNLQARQVISTDVLEQSQATYDSARSNLIAAQADLNAARINVDSATISISTAEGNYNAAQADVAATQADVETARADLSITEAERATAQADYEAAKADQLTVETELESALAKQESAEIMTQRCLLTAPFDGQIIGRSFQVGQVAAPGSAAFQLLQTKGLEVSARLSSTNIRDQANSQSIRFVADGLSLAVKQRAVIEQVNNRTGTQEVRFTMSDLHNLPVGKSGRLQWQGEKPLLPPNWLVRRDNQLGVMLAQDNKAIFYPLSNAKEGQPTLTDLTNEALLIDNNRLRVRHNQPISIVTP